MRRLLFLCAVSAALAACNCGGSVTTQQSCSASVPCPTGQECVNQVCKPLPSSDGGTDGGTDAGHFPDAGSATLTGLRLDPASATIISADGARTTQSFVAMGTFSDGIDRVVDPTFTADPQVIGSIHPDTGLFTASGTVGGKSDVKAAITRNGQTFNAAATLTVKLVWTTADPSLPGNIASQFGTPVTDPSRTAEVVYPLDGVVFPQNVAPADVQWLQGNTGDTFRLTFSKTDVTFVAYVAEDGDHHHLPSEAAWRALAQTNPTQAAQLVVDRLDQSSGATIAGTPLSMKFARAALTGSVYYWDIGAGRIVRIDDGTTTRTNFMPNPPAATDNARCVGCHTVGPSGRYMAGRLGGDENIGAVFDLTTNLTADPAPTVWPISNTVPYSPTWWTASFNPDETRIVTSQLETTATGGMKFFNPLSGTEITFANPVPDKVTHVAWAPDGKSIAYVDNFITWGGDFVQGDISVVPVPADQVLGTPAKLHLGAALSSSFPAGSADSYPSWAPDSSKLAFSHGNGCRSETHSAALYVMNKDGSNVVRMSKASGGPTGASSFQPRFSPFTADGYYWMTFLTRRDYGNARVGTRGADRQQIWVAAVKANPQPGDDPSEVAYWLPGQATTSRNIAAYWAAKACRKQGDACTVGSECCSTVCAPNGSGALVCSPPPPTACRKEGESCGAASDCCSGKGLVCRNNSCQVDIQ